MRFNFVVWLLICFSPLYSQEVLEKNESKSLEIRFGADWAKGINAGLAYHLSGHFSIEMNYGRDVLDFVSLSDPDSRFSLGLNWQPRLSSNIILNLCYTNVDFVNVSGSEQYIISGSIGSGGVIRNSLGYFYRIGVIYRTEHNNDGTNNLVFPNLGLGLNYLLF